MPTENSVCVQTDHLRVGTVIKNPIHDTANNLLLAGGVKITEQIKEGLKRRKVLFVFLHPDDARSSAAFLSSDDGPNIGRSPSEEPKNDVQSKFDALVATVPSGVNGTGQAIREKVVFPGAVPYNSAQKERLTKAFNAATSLLSGTISSVIQGSKQGAVELASVATTYVSELTEDSGHVLSTADDMTQSADISTRMVRMSILAMAIAIELGFDEECVHTVGISALVHDWGLLLLGNRFSNFDHPLTEDDWLVYEKHPTKTVDLLEGMAGIPGIVSLVAYQVHERPDGSGYPKGRRGEAIHIFAKIIAVADAYISLGSTVRGRPALIPYEAMLCLVQKVKQGKLDGDVVRALVRTLSMFPVGSHLLLDDGSEVKVLRSNREEYTKPIVQKLADKKGIRIDMAHKETIIDLADSPLKPATPLATPGRKQMKLDSELLDEVSWDGPGS